MTRNDFDREDVALLVRLGMADGGRVDPSLVAARPRGSRVPAIFAEAQRLGWLDSGGWVTRTGERETKQ